MTCLPRPIRQRTRIAACVVAAAVVLGAGAQSVGAQSAGAQSAGVETPVGAQQALMPPALMPPHAVLKPERTDANIDGIVLACEPSGQGADSILQLLVYPRGGERLLPDRRDGAAPKAEPGASIVLDDRAFGSSLLFADRYAVMGDRSGAVAGLSDEFVAALLQADTMVLRFDLLEETVGAPPRFDSETTIRLDGSERAAIRAVAHCGNPRVAA